VDATLIGSRITDPASPTSPLLRLPPEVRNTIYAYAFSGCEIIAYYSYPQPQVESSGAGPSFERCKTLFAPTMVCRQMYAETRLLPYKYSEYDVRTCQVFEKWLDHLDEAARAMVWAKLEEFHMVGWGYKLERIEIYLVPG
jgi:hypothetical protein